MPAISKVIVPLASVGNLTVPDPVLNDEIVIWLSLIGFGSLFVWLEFSLGVLLLSVLPPGVLLLSVEDPPELVIIILFNFVSSVTGFNDVIS